MVRNSSPTQICLRTFAPPRFSPPSNHRQPQCRRDTALPKFACSHLHLRHFPGRFTSAKPNTDKAPSSSNLLAHICTSPFSPPSDRRQTQAGRGSATLKFACAHLHLPVFHRRPTTAKLRPDKAPPPSNLLAHICTSPFFTAVRPPPNSGRTRLPHPQIYLRTFV